MPLRGEKLLILLKGSIDVMSSSSPGYHTQAVEGERRGRGSEGERRRDGETKIRYLPLPLERVGGYPGTEKTILEFGEGCIVHPYFGNQRV